VIEGSAAAGFLWRGLVPLIPFVLLLNIRIWRNLCPLGRLSEGRPGGDTLSARPRIGVAVLLFAAILPVRAAWLANDPMATVVFLGILAGGAWLLGRRRIRRAGFCTTVCPMLPVELLYGQSPVVEVGRGPCDSCSLCTARACPQLSPSAAIAQHLGDARHGTGWTRTPFGAFAAAFPGVIAGFFTGDPATPVAAAATLAFGAFVSWTGVTAAVMVLRPRWDRAVLALGFGAIGLWSWFALPVVAEAWGWPAGGRAAALIGLVGALAWFVNGMRRTGRAAAYSPPGSSVRIT